MKGSVLPFFLYSFLASTPSLPAAADDASLTSAIGQFLCYKQHWRGEMYATPMIKVVRGTILRDGSITKFSADRDLLNETSDPVISEVDIGRIYGGFSGVVSYESTRPFADAAWTSAYKMFKSGTPFVADLSDYRCEQNALTDPVLGSKLIDALVKTTRYLSDTKRGERLRVTIPEFSIADPDVFVIAGHSTLYIIRLDLGKPSNYLHYGILTGGPFRVDDVGRYSKVRIIRVGKHIVRW